MAEKSYFWDSVGGDRVYSSADFADWMNNIVAGASGVIRGILNNLSPSTVATLNSTYNTGAAIFQGRVYINNASLPLTHVAPTSGKQRMDAVVVRFDASTLRAANLTIIQGTEVVGTPSAPAITGVDVLIAYVKIDNTSGTNLTTVTDARTLLNGPWNVLQYNSNQTVSQMARDTQIILSPSGAMALDISAGVAIAGSLINLVNTTSQIITVTTITGGTFTMSKGTVTLEWDGSAYALVGSGGCIPRIQFNTGTAATWKMPFTGRLQAIIVGGGGGGGGGGQTGGGAGLQSGGQGGGSGFVVTYRGLISSGTTITYTIGSGGAGGAAGNPGNSGTNGSNTTFNDGLTTYTAKGGIGGVSANQSYTVGYSSGAGGAGGGCASSNQGAGGINKGGRGANGSEGESRVTPGTSNIAGGAGGDMPQFNSVGGAGGAMGGVAGGGGGGGGGFEVNGGAGGAGSGASSPGVGGSPSGGGAGGGGGGGAVSSVGAAGGTGGTGTLVIEFI